MGLYNAQLKESLESILNIPLEETQWQQATLPVAKGGLGVRLASDIALPAFLSSSYGAGAGMAKLLPQAAQENTYDLQTEAEDDWKELFGTDENNNVSIPTVPHEQAAWDLPIVDKKYKELLEFHIKAEDKSRLLVPSCISRTCLRLASSCPHSSAGLETGQ